MINEYSNKFTVIPKPSAPSFTVIPKPGIPSFVVIPKPYPSEQNSLLAQDEVELLTEAGYRILIEIG